MVMASNQMFKKIDKVCIVTITLLNVGIIGSGEVDLSLCSLSFLFLQLFVFFCFSKKTNYFLREFFKLFLHVIMKSEYNSCVGTRSIRIIVVGQHKCIICSKNIANKLITF